MSFQRSNVSSVQLRLFDIDDEAPHADWTLLDFFDRWYAPTVLGDRSRRPTSQATLDRRRKPVEYWTDLMKSPEHPWGPPICGITTDMLAIFRDRLRTATYSRGPLGFPRPLSETTQLRAMQELQIVLAACGASGRGPRAGLLAQPPRIWTEAVECEPPEVWTIAEARAIAAAIDLTKPPQCRNNGSQRLDIARMRDLARATLALWYYTGHRSSTYRILRWEQLIEARPGVWYLRISRSVKTRKADKVRVHPELRELIEKLRGMDADKIFPWPVSYWAIADWHSRWQIAAELPASRRLPIKTWRAMHAAALSGLALNSAEQLASVTLGHSSTEITRSSYHSARNALLPLLPPLFSL